MKAIKFVLQPPITGAVRIQGNHLCDGGSDSGSFCLSDVQKAAIRPFVLRDQPRPEREEDRPIISETLHVLAHG